MQIIVQRGAGDIPSPQTINEPLLCSLEALLDRGGQELDASSPDRMTVTPSCGSIETVQPTVLVEMKDAERTDRGQLTYWSKSGRLTETQGGVEWTVECNLQVERLDE